MNLGTSPAKISVYPSSPEWFRAFPSVLCCRGMSGGALLRGHHRCREIAGVGREHSVIPVCCGGFPLGCRFDPGAEHRLGTWHVQASRLERAFATGNCHQNFWRGCLNCDLCDSGMALIGVFAAWGSDGWGVHWRVEKFLDGVGG